MIGTGVVVAACNTILGNDDGVLRRRSDGGPGSGAGGTAGEAGGAGGVAGAGGLTGVGGTGGAGGSSGSGAVGVGGIGGSSGIGGFSGVAGTGATSGAGGTTGTGGIGGQGGTGGTTGTGGTGGTTGTGGTGGTTGTGGMTGTGGFAGSAGAPAACPASEAGNTPTGTDTVVAGTVNSYTYTNVTGPGQYAKIVQGWSKAFNNCQGDSGGTLCNTVYKEAYQSNGALAPFNEDQSMIFSGQTELFQIGVYYPSGGTWQRVAYWDRCVTQGLAFTGNRSWYECGGFVQSYIGAYDSAAGSYPSSAAPVQFSGTVMPGTEVDVFSSTLCTGITKGTDCGWSSGKNNLRGFTGDAAGSKIFATKFRMPITAKAPSYWILPSQVLRTSQYGCNCRGMGCDATYKGGCGELDVVELVGSDMANLEQSTSIYSFQACYGGVGRWSRPVNETALFLVIFHAPTKQIAIRRLTATGFDFAGSVTDAQVNAWLAMPGGSKAMP
jgi:hypothetical protein